MVQQQAEAEEDATILQRVGMAAETAVGGVVEILHEDEIEGGELVGIT